MGKNIFYVYSVYILMHSDYEEIFQKLHSTYGFLDYYEDMYFCDFEKSMW